MNFSENLIKLRKQAGLSQEDLANELDVSRQTVSKWELGVTTPEMEKLVQMAKLFEISVDDLISKDKVTINTAKAQNTKSTASTYSPNNYSSSEPIKKPKASSKVAVVILISVMSLALVGYLGFLGYTIFNNLWRAQSIINQVEQTVDESKKNVTNEVESKTNSNDESNSNTNSSVDSYEEARKRAQEYVNSDEYKEQIKKVKEIIESDEYKDLQESIRKQAGF